jgi:hypothetical protein
MASIEDVVAGVRAALDRVAMARGILTSILDSWEQTGGTYAELSAGSTQPHLGNAAAYLEHAYDQVRRIIATLDLATTHAHDYVTSIAGQLTPGQVATLRRQLPEPIKPAERGTGRKTHGRWNDVCSGDLSCEDLLPVMLPAGCSLTVHAPNDRRTFIGGAQP